MLGLHHHYQKEHDVPNDIYFEAEEARRARDDLFLDIVAEALPYSGAGRDEALALLDALHDRGYFVVRDEEGR